MLLENAVFRFQVGTFSCAIRVSVARYPLSPFIHNLPKELYEPWLRERGQDADFVDGPYTCRDGFKPTPGQVSELLRTMGVGQDEIDTVILTHMHPDHSGGCLTEEVRPTFPNANYRMSREEFDYWTSIAAFGHTPSHLLVEIRSASEKLLFSSDAFIHPMHLDYPEGCAVFDHHPEKMLLTTVDLLERAARDAGAWGWRPRPVPAPHEA